MKIRTLLLACVVLLNCACATKTLQVTVPEVPPAPHPLAYVKIVAVNDVRQFARSPTTASTPSIENDLIDNKSITDKAIGRMRHGLLHKALWNYTLTGDETIYSVCSKIVINSLNLAGLNVVSAGEEGYAEAVPIAVDVVQFWAWMQPQFNIDLHFDGELRLTSTDNSRPLSVSATGNEFFSTAYAGGSAWTKLVNQGVADLQQNLTDQLQQSELANP
ncbi:hypothetical protein [Halioxenophilus sp. WMMB6]|uniref:hypothetical protein n=1 Tax=Halioxenophilus sp. WMMB6 TaxID=3073815 RepID=UPI00295E59F5|nr:hypothetical protein [Halioxenophilus sp. WMMB6]